MNVNHLTFAGNLVRDPQTRHAGTTAVCSITIANTRKYTSNGEQKEDTIFLDCEAWGKTAEHLAQYYSKGKPILVEGRLRQDNWQDRESGKMRNKIVLVIERTHFVPDGKPRAQPSQPASPGQPATPTNPPVHTDLGDDEPPF
jgi:single-strand DNA-binding protein